MKNVLIILLLAGLGVSLYFNYKSGSFNKIISDKDHISVINDGGSSSDRRLDSLNITFKVTPTKEFIAAIKRMPATSTVMPEQTYMMSASVDCIDENGNDCFQFKGSNPTVGGGTIPNDFFKLTNSSIKVFNSNGMKIKLRQLPR